MPELTLSEEVVLIALDDESGAGKMRLGLDWAVAGATVIDLALARRIDVDDSDKIAVLNPEPLGIAHLDVELEKIVRGGSMKVGKVLRLTHKSAQNGAISALVERGVLKQETKRLFGVIPVGRYPEAEGNAEAEVRGRLSAALLNGDEPDERTAALVSVLQAGKLGGKAFPDVDRKQMKARMTEISEGRAVSPSVRKAVLRTQRAIIAIIAMAAAASSGG
jgi:hypothetical protein